MYILIHVLVFVQVCLKSPKCFTNFEPRIQNPLSERIIGDREQWTLDISFLDKAAVLKNKLLNRGTCVQLKRIWSTNWLFSMAFCIEISYVQIYHHLSIFLLSCRFFFFCTLHHLCVIYQLFDIFIFLFFLLFSNYKISTYFSFSV